jgi:hypothetical protein
MPRVRPDRLAIEADTAALVKPGTGELESKSPHPSADGSRPRDRIRFPASSGRMFPDGEARSRLHPSRGTEKLVRGVLPNGLSWYLRPAESPGDRVLFRLVVAAGGFGRDRVGERIRALRGNTWPSTAPASIRDLPGRSLRFFGRRKRAGGETL